jgi:hypothetical protein
MVKCVDGVERICIIRGKFRGGRGKRNNLLTVNTWVLVGLREWNAEATESKESTKCDLLEVYTESDRKELKKVRGINWDLIEPQVLFSGAAKDDDIFGTDDFDEEEDEAARLDQKCVKLVPAQTLSSDDGDDDGDDDDKIDVDDI